MSCNILRRSYDEDYDVCLFAVNKARADAYYLSAFRADDGSMDVVVIHYQKYNAKLPTMEIIEDGQFGGFESVSEAIRHFLPDVNFCDADWIFHQADREMEAPDSYDDVLKLREE